MPVIISPIGGSGSGGGGGGTSFPASGVKRYSAAISGTTGTITAATHDLGATADLAVILYRDDGATQVPINAQVVTADTGDVTWTVGESITGRILILGRA